jgi:DNA-binding beta-propeller fold protein YncE
MTSPRTLNFLIFALTLLCLSTQTHAQTVVATIPLGQIPSSIAVNSKTNIVYATCQFPTTLKVVDGATNSVTATIPLNSIFLPPNGRRVHQRGSIPQELTTAQANDLIAAATRIQHTLACH